MYRMNRIEPNVSEELTVDGQGSIEYTHGMYIPTSLQTCVYFGISTGMALGVSAQGVKREGGSSSSGGKGESDQGIHTGSLNHGSLSFLRSDPPASGDGSSGSTRTQTPHPALKLSHGHGFAATSSRASLLRDQISALEEEVRPPANTHSWRSSARLLNSTAEQDDENTNNHDDGSANGNATDGTGDDVVAGTRLKKAGEPDGGGGGLTSGLRGREISGVGGGLDSDGGVFQFSVESVYGLEPRYKTMAFIDKVPVRCMHCNKTFTIFPSPSLSCAGQDKCSHNYILSYRKQLCIEG